MRHLSRRPTCSEPPGASSTSVAGRKSCSARQRGWSNGPTRWPPAEGPAAAVSLLEQAEAGVAALPAVRQALERHAASLRLQREAEARAAEVRRQLENAKKAFDRGDVDTCVRAAEAILRLQPAQADALDLQRRAAALAAARKAEERRRALSAEALRDAERELQGSRFQAARQAVDRALGLWPGNPDAHRIGLDVDRRQADSVERTRREEGARRLMAGSDDKLARGDLDGARRALAAAVSTWSEVPGAAALRKRIDRQEQTVRTVVSGSSRRRVLPYAGFGIAGALALAFGLVYFRSGASAPETRTQVVNAVPPRALSLPAAERQGSVIIAPPLPHTRPAVKHDEPAAAALTAEVARRNRAARRFYEAGKYDDAMKALGQVLAIAPSDGDAKRIAGPARAT